MMGMRRGLRIEVRCLCLLLAGSSACGANAAGDPKVNAQNRSVDSANIAQQATEPRRNDSTAALPPTRTRPTNTTGSGTAPGVLDIEAMKAAALNRNPNEPLLIRARQVLIQWAGAERAASAVARSRAQALTLAQEIARRAQGKEDFARLAIEFSDEPGAAQRGGSLGQLTRGQLPRPVEDVACSLQVGQISDVIESSRGFHVIQRTE